MEFVARKAARLLTNQYRPYVEFEDMLQEARLWLFTHPQNIEHAILSESGRIYQPQLVSEVATYLTPRAKKEKARSLGVTTTHQSRYTVEAVEAVLPALWDLTPTPIPGTPETAGRGASDPAYGGGFHVAVMDVKRAMAAVTSKAQQKVLFVVYGMGTTGREAQWFSKVPRGEIEGRARRAVQAIVNHLNDEPDLYYDGPGSRKAMSNAQSNAINEDGYGG